MAVPETPYKGSSLGLFNKVINYLTSEWLIQRNERPGPRKRSPTQHSSQQSENEVQIKSVLFVFLLLIVAFPILRSETQFPISSHECLKMPQFAANSLRRSSGFSDIYLWAETKLWSVVCPSHCPALLLLSSVHPSSPLLHLPNISPSHSVKTSISALLYGLRYPAFHWADSSHSSHPAPFANNTNNSDPSFNFITGERRERNRQTDGEEGMEGEKGQNMFLKHPLGSLGFKGILCFLYGTPILRYFVGRPQRQKTTTIPLNPKLKHKAGFNNQQLSTI